jgi:hypothetical protein
VRVSCLEEALAIEAIHMGIERSGTFGGHSPARGTTSSGSAGALWPCEPTHHGDTVADSLAERHADINERHQARVASTTDLAESLHATCEWQAALDELQAAFVAADGLGARLAAATAHDPTRELPPDRRPKPRP